MANKETTIDLKLNTASLILGVKAAKVALSGLDKVLSSIADSMAEAFSVKGFTDYKQTLRRFGKDLADDLLVLQLNFGKLKAAISDAAAPLASVLAPMLNTAVRAATDFARTVGGVVDAVIAGITGSKTLAQRAAEAAGAEKKLASAATAAGRAVRGSLMRFDQLQRLNAPTGGGGGSSAQTVTGPTIPPISDRAQAIADKILAILAPLRAIDFTPLLEALGHLQSAFSAMASVAASALEWLWYQVITPFAAWVAEVFAPAFTEAWAAAMSAAATALQPVMAGLQSLFTALQPVVSYIGESVVNALGLWQSAFERLGTVFAVHSPQITGILTNIGTVLTQVWAMVQPILEALRQRFSDTFTAVSGFVSTAAGAILQALYGVTEYLAGVFTGDWQRSWGGIKTILAGLINGIIGLLNGMLSRLGAALNSVISAANRLHFTVPDWVPGLGGASFGVNMAPVSVPQIPYLARGAVLPANRPFLAMVGDQHSGTNIEAPLATIQQAVASVLADQSAALAAGIQTSVGVQREILEAVLGITIGDEVIGAAADRYRTRQAYITGGVL